MGFLGFSKFLIFYENNTNFSVWMHLKVFLKLEKNLKTLSFGQIYEKKTKKHKKTLGWVFFLKTGVFPTLFQGVAVCGVPEAHCERAQECRGQVSLSTERLPGRGGFFHSLLSGFEKMK